MRRSRLIPVAAAAVALTATSFAPANAAVADPTVVADGLVTPLSVAANDSAVVFAQNFAGQLDQVSTDGGAVTPLYTAKTPGTEVGAVSAAPDGSFMFATTGADAKRPSARLMKVDSAGTVSQVANLWAYEKQHNPDAATRYGLLGLSASCQKRFTGELKQALPYNGIKESHPYASVVSGTTTYVADAAGNDILAVSPNGTVRTAATLPATTVKITRKIRKALHAPFCAVGHRYRLEPVPTDLDMGPDGNLYVTSLPGGPEDPSMGANGRVYQVNPSTHAVKKIVGGLVSPTGIAVASDGTAYISMLFASTIVRKPLNGPAETFASVPFPGDVDVVGTTVYATQTGLDAAQDAPPSGRVLSWSTAPAVQ